MIIQLSDFINAIGVDGDVTPEILAELVEATIEELSDIKLRRAKGTYDPEVDQITTVCLQLLPRINKRGECVPAILEETLVPLMMKYRAMFSPWMLHTVTPLAGGVLVHSTVDYRIQEWEAGRGNPNVTEETESETEEPVVDMCAPEEDDNGFVSSWQLPRYLQMNARSNPPRRDTLIAELKQPDREVPLTKGTILSPRGLKKICEPLMEHAKELFEGLSPEEATERYGMAAITQTEEATNTVTYVVETDVPGGIPVVSIWEPKGKPELRRIVSGTRLTLTHALSEGHKGKLVDPHVCVELDV